jgi:homoserine O-succinyltransferase
MALYTRTGPGAVMRLRREGLDIRRGAGAAPLRVALLNLMPDKRQAERQTARLLAQCAVDVSLSLFLAPGHRPRGESPSYLARHYRAWSRIARESFDALIVTGTPLETLPFEDVRYWCGLREVLDWSRERVASSWFSCWGAMAALHHDHGVPKRTLAHKCFGVFELEVLDAHAALTRGLGGRYRVPVSRNAEVPRRWLECHGALKVLSHSPASGVGLVAERGLRRVYMLDHPEYEADTLLREYRRDRCAGLATPAPRGVDVRDAAPLPAASWQRSGVTLLGNWLCAVARMRAGKVADAA